MSIASALENFGVEVTFAQANAWSACPTHHDKPKEDHTVTTQTMKRKNARNKAMLFGVLSIGLYAAVFSRADAITELFARGGAYALLPVGAVFVFSYVHGNFAGAFWSALGIEGSAKKTTVRKEAPAVKQPQAQPRPRLHA